VCLTLLVFAEQMKLKFLEEAGFIGKTTPKQV
jgi:hypothetical protein